MPTDCCPRCWAFETGICAKPDCDCHGCACGTPERPGTHGVHCLGFPPPRPSERGDKIPVGARDVEYAIFAFRQIEKMGVELDILKVRLRSGNDSPNAIANELEKWMSIIRDQCRLGRDELNRAHAAWKLASGIEGRSG